MTDDSWKSAKDLMAELEKDPEYLRIRRERDDKVLHRERKYAELARPILEKLHSIGFAPASIEEVASRNSHVPPEVVSILLAHVTPDQDPRLCESIVRALGAARDGFDGTALAQCYDDTSDESLRWAIANTIALTHPHSIGRWIAERSECSPLKEALRKLGYFGDR